MDETRDHILDAAHRVFSEEGFRGTTTRRVAADAGVNEVTLFRHFATKEALLRAAIERQSALSIAALSARPLPATPADPRAELREYLLATLGGFLRGRQAVRTAIGEWGHHPPLNAPLLRTTNHVYDELERYLGAAQAAGLIRAALDVVVVTEVLMATVFADGMLREMLPSRFPLSPEDSVAAYLDAVLDGILPSPHSPEESQ